MLDYLDSLRKKPEPERRKAVLMISLGITVLVAIIWGVTMYFRLSETDFSLGTESVRSEMPSLKETFSNFFTGIGNVFDSVSNSSTTGE
jgi:hypothetical protein